MTLKSARGAARTKTPDPTGGTPPGSLRQRTYDRLKVMLLGGDFRPAEHLSESRLSALLGVSRTPLREALMKLEEEGLVVGRRNLGYTVTSLDVREVCDLLVVREALDACAAELACIQATDEDLATITGLVDRMAVLHDTRKTKPADAAADLELGLEIHEVIARATRNEPLMRLTTQIYQRLRIALWLEVLWVDWENAGLDEHRAIASAIVARDPNAAAAAARRHVQSSLANMAKVQAIYEHRRLKP